MQPLETLPNRSYKEGDKVVPVSKTVAEPFESSLTITLARQLGQPYLVVKSKHGKFYKCEVRGVVETYHQRDLVLYKQKQEATQ